MPRLATRPAAMAAMVALLAAVVGAEAPPLDITATDQITAKKVVELMEQGHMARPKIDDATSKKWCRTFLKDLDPQKYYFDKADVGEFFARETVLDDEIKAGKLDFAKLVMERFVKRSDERLAVVLGLLKQVPDFTVDESIDDDPDKIEYPADAAEANERWRKRIKLDWLTEKIDGVDDAEIVRKLTIRYRDRNRAVHQFNTSDLLKFYLSALSTTFDPHSSYLPARDLDNFMNQTLHLSLTGIGASLQSEDGYAVVMELIPGGPADKDGRIEPGDKIVGIKRPNGEEIDFVEKKLDDVVAQIRGEAGTKVNLIIQPADSKERKNYELIRAKVELAEAHAKGQIIQSTSEDGKPIKVGVISLPAFYGDTAALNQNDPNAVSATEDCRKLIRDFKAKKVDAVMLDLRGNGGGLLNESITLSGLFIDKGPVVQIREASGVKHLDDEDAGTEWDGPLVVLINRLSASASEIFAGVIKDYGRGLIIGDSSTFGKGTVQSIVPINEPFSLRSLGGRSAVPRLGALKLTIQQFYRANGDSTQIQGVVPDIHIPTTRDQADWGEGHMDNAVKFDKVAALPHDMFNRVPTDLVNRLGTRSEERRKSNDKFRKQDELIKKAVERKARHQISLNEAKFRAEFVPDDDEDKPKVKEKVKKRFTEKPAWESDYYNDEVVKIVNDYLTLGSKALAAAPVRSAGR